MKIEAHKAADSATALSATRSRGAIVLRVIMALVIGGALFWLGHFAIHSYRYADTEDAYIIGRIHQISSQIGGQVQELLVNDNYEVKAGAVLVKLDPLACEIAVQRAEAALAQVLAQQKQAAEAVRLAEAQLSENQAKANQSQSQVRLSNAQLELARLTWERSDQLFQKGGVVSSADHDSAKAGLDTATASKEAAEANAAASASAVVSSNASIASARAQMAALDASSDAARAVLRDAKRQLSYNVITAPTDGRIGSRKIEVGNTIAAGQTLMALTEPDMWIVANFKETQLANMRVGQDAEITIDAIPGESLHGRVESMSPASGAQFALLPPDNATGNFNKVVQRVPVKIVLDPADIKRLYERLRLGLSVVVDVRVR